MMVRYVKAVHVQYYDTTGSLDLEDINKGFGGEYVYLVPEYTFDRSQAAHAFSLLTTCNADLSAADISKGGAAGRGLYRYICAYYNGSDDSRIVRVWLSKTQDTTEGDGRTANLNDDRGGRFLYLCWENESDDRTGSDRSRSSDVISVNSLVDASSSIRAHENSEGSTIQVPIDSLLFSQSNVDNSFSETPEARDGGEFRLGDDIQQIVTTLCKMNVGNRKAIVDLFPLMNVVPVPYSGAHYLMSCDNRRLHIFRAVLPPGTLINVVQAPDGEIERLDGKWGSRDGLNVMVRAGKRNSGGPLLKDHFRGSTNAKSQLLKKWSIEPDSTSTSTSTGTGTVSASTKSKLQNIHKATLDTYRQTISAFKENISSYKSASDSTRKQDDWEQKIDEETLAVAYLIDDCLTQAASDAKAMIRDVRSVEDKNAAADYYNRGLVYSVNGIDAITYEIQTVSQSVAEIIVNVAAIVNSIGNVINAAADGLWHQILAL